MRKLTPELQRLWDAMISPPTPEEENGTQIDFVMGVIRELVRMDGVNIGQEQDAGLKPLEWHAAYPVKPEDSEELWASHELAVAMVEYRQEKARLDQQIVLGGRPKIAEMLNLGALLGRATYAAYVAFTQQVHAEEVLLAQGRKGNEKGAASRTRWKLPFAFGYVAFREAYKDLPITEKERLGIEAAQAFALTITADPRSEWHCGGVPKDVRQLRRCIDDRALEDTANFHIAQLETDISLTSEGKLADAARNYVARKFKLVRRSEQQWELRTVRQQA